MIISIGQSIIYYPYEEISPEQIQIMFILDKLWKKKTNGIVGIPPAINLPITIVCFFLSSNLEIDKKIRLIYVSETNNETIRISQNLEDCLSNIKNNRKNLPKSIFCITPILDKTKLCIHKNFKNNYKEAEMEDFCLSLILPQMKKNVAKKKQKNKKIFRIKEQKCLYYQNFEKKRFRKKMGIWNVTNIRGEAYKKKICPFYFSKELMFDSQVILIDSKRFFSTEIFDINFKKLLKTSVLIMDTMRSFDTVLGNLAISEINSIILKDSIRGILYLKKKFLNLSYNKFSFLMDKVPVKNLENLSLLRLLASRKKGNISSRNFFLNRNKLENLNSLKILNLIVILRKISGFILSVLTKKIELNTSLDQFFNILICAIKGFGLNSNFFLHFSQYVFLLAFKSGTLEYRFLTGLKYLGLFLYKSGSLLESTNENFRMIGIRKTTSRNFILESSLCLCCFEIPVFSRLVFENTISFLILTTECSFLYSNQSIFDQKQLYFGNLKFIVKRCLLSYQEIILGKNLYIPEPRKFFQKKTELSRKLISVLTKISESSPTGIVCLFSSYVTLLEVIRNLNDPVTFKKIKNKRNIFIELFLSDSNKDIIEEYKISCDLGIRSIFFGILEGLATQTNMENYYSRIVLKVQTRSIYSNRFKKIHFFYKNFLFSRFSFYRFFDKMEKYNRNFIVRKFFGSKKDYGVFLDIKQIQDNNDNIKKDSIDTIVSQKIIKNESLSTVQKIDRFFYSFSDFNIGI